MKWGRKKLISNMFPSSWVSKFKQKSNNDELNRKQNLVTLSSPQRAAATSAGKFYAREGDSIWRLSYDFDEEAKFTESRCRICGSNVSTGEKNEEIQKLNNLKVNVRSSEQQAVIKTPRLQAKKGQRSKQLNDRVLEGKRWKTTSNEAEKRSIKSCRISSEKGSSEWEKLKEMKIKELKTKNANQRKSEQKSREPEKKRSKITGKVKVSSPRIRALEMKKAKIKIKGKEKIDEGRTSQESFIVVKCSFDPQKDFRDSMMEMIMEKQISQPEELEDLLTWYLTLNSEEYHDLIVKVFRQLQFDLDRIRFSAELFDEI